MVALRPPVCILLGNNHGGSANQYGADTLLMSVPVNYTTSEVTDGTSLVLPTSAPDSSCTLGKYQLLGYSYGPTPEDAVIAPQTIDAPVFTALEAEVYVIVWNKTCAPPPPPPQTGRLQVIKRTIGGGDDKVFNFTGSGALGSFQIKTDDHYGAKFFRRVPVGTYTITESVPPGWKIVTNTCTNIRVKLNGMASCTIVNKRIEAPRGESGPKDRECRENRDEYDNRH